MAQHPVKQNKTKQNFPLHSHRPVLGHVPYRSINLTQTAKFTANMWNIACFMRVPGNFRLRTMKNIYNTGFMIEYGALCFSEEWKLNMTRFIRHVAVKLVGLTVFLHTLCCFSCSNYHIMCCYQDQFFYGWWLERGHLRCDVIWDFT